MRRALMVLALAASSIASPAAAQDPARAPALTHNLLVRVQAAEGQFPLGYSVVALPALGIEQFTSANGAIVLRLPVVGQQRIIVKRLGFSPKDTVITIADAPSTLVTIRLTRLSVKLQEVTVIGWPPCLRPGLRDAEPEVRSLVEQISQNAERYRLLTRSYPFTYLMEREFGHRASDGSYIADERSSIVASATPEWKYRPGTLVALDVNRADWVMRIPSIGDLAERSFIDNHCFHIAGVEVKEDVRLLRIDIVAARRLRDVDVNVVTWLDTADYQLRHASFTLTRPPRQVQGLVGTVSTARYHELIPFVPVIEQLVAENTVRLAGNQRETRVLIERQRNVRVTYTGPRPDSLATDTIPPPAR